MKRKNVISLVLAVILLISLLTACGSNVSFKIDFIVDGAVIHTIDTKGNEEIQVPTDPEKEGYIFDGWYWDKDTWEKPFTANSLLNAPLSENMSVYAKWKTEGENEVQTYTITFNSNGGGDISAITKEAGESITEPTAPTKTGYTFDGWYTDNNTFENEYTFSTMPAESFTLYAKWIEDEPQPVTYTITFNSNGGGDISAITKEAGESITEPTAPTKTGYTFDGWYTDNNTFINEYEFTTMPAESFTLYAKWIEDEPQPIEYTITFNSNGGGDISAITKEAGESITEPTAPTKTGYTFDGWYTDNNTFQNEYTFSTMPAESFTLYAKWIEDEPQPVTYTITFNSNGGGDISAITKEAGESITEPTAPTKTGYTFDGWYTDNNTFENEYTFSTMPAESFTLYAKWIEDEPQPVTYTITFNSNGGGDISAITKEAGESITEPTAPTKTGYTFDGWYTDNNTFQNEYTFSSMPAESFTLYAKWIEDEPQAQTEYTRINASGEPAVDGDYIWFGEYPQTIKANDVTITETIDGRGYYLGSDGYYYAKVTATPRSSGYTFSTFATVSSGTVYYFKVEPIKWRILSEENGTALILCESIIANKRYNEYYEGTKNGVYANNYKESEIRAWLNNEFYNTAFNTLQQELIQKTEVDNSVYSTGHSSNPYTCENTNDKIFLPSYREMVNTAYGFSSNGGDDDTARRRLTSDYSRATGVWMNTNTTYYGNGCWWLRSPNDDYSDDARDVFDYGYISDYNYVHIYYYGVVPALKIRLSTPQPIEYTISFDSNGGSSVTAITKEAGESINEPTAPTKTGYTFDGWYTNTFINEYEFTTMPEESFTLYAKWICDDQNDFDTNGYYHVDNYIWFGEYPQTIKANDVTITETIDGRGYYLGSDGYYYAKVTATPFISGYTFSTFATVSSGTVYYFKVEPIKWRILSEENGTALILCESIIAKKRYDDSSSNNYMNSEIRAWLNGEFYNKAFTALQQELIQITEVDNSVYSTGYSSNSYACANTNDKIFLPSYREMVNTAYGFSSNSSDYDTARRRLTSDYSRATGAYMKNAGTSYYGNGYWWLRSPRDTYSDEARSVGYNGFIYNYNGVHISYYGVVPALKIRLSTPQPNEYTISFDSNGGSFDSNGGSNVTAITKEAGVSITAPTAPTRTGYTFDGWYTDNDTFINEYEFTTMPEESFTLYAKWIWDGQNDFDTNGYYLVDNYIWFGEYPQTIKANDVTITETIDGRGYYLGSDDCYYAKVTATPYENGYKFSTRSTVSSGMVYYFKVEPIKWRILEESGGTALILCESIIANKRYDDSSNNYMNSEIRAWLNNEFYNTAFNTLQQELIQKTEVDNSVDSTGYSSNPYTCANTNDKIFLPSYREMVNTTYGFSSDYDTARRRLTSDYSRATGAYMNTDTSYYGNGYWWLRSPYYYDSNRARGVGRGGLVSSSYGVSDGLYGLVPALKIRLSTPQPIEYTITFNSNGGGDISAITKEAGESITEPTAPTKTGYTFDGWYTDNNTFQNEYTFSSMPAESFTLYAKWIEDEPYTRINASGVPTANGNYILFGEYPQTIKANEVTVGTSADTRGYYLGSDDCYYAKVTTTPYENGYKFSTRSIVPSGMVYYFKVEPIKWRILEESGGTALILCESIIANKRYNEYYEGTKNGVYANNYKESEIRAWLNNEFYNTAFNTLQQELIQKTEVDNSVYSTGNSSDYYACANTNDKIFLPSYREMVNTAYGFSREGARRRLTSDYSRATGVWMITDTDTSYGIGHWWLRSPRSNSSYDARHVHSGGVNGNDRVGSTHIGVVPALKIRLSTPQPIEYTITFNSNGGGDISAITKEAGESITEPTAPTKTGYTFDGWYTDNNTFQNEYTFSTMPAESFTLYAKWIEDEPQPVTYTITFNSNGGGDVSAITKEAGESINEPTAPTRTGYTFGGWYTDNDTFLNEYSFTSMPEESFTLYAKWIWDGQNDYDTNGYYRVDNYIWFGEYPQTIKANDVTITETIDGRGYYLGSDDCYYAKVTATPYTSGYTFSTSATVTSGTVYYFKVEPIKWRILEESGGTALILCESIIANKRYDDSSNNYMNSEIRAWLNGEFYNKAFTALQQELIQITNVDNSVYSTGYSSNAYACANTNDNIFLPSYREVTNTLYGFNSAASRYRQTSDYSRATGAAISTSANYYGNGFWWLRSPSIIDSSYARSVYSDGYFDNGDRVRDTYDGVVPALRLRLS